nr:hypothetical protein [uncultured Flavobacterium sp.]
MEKINAVIFQNQPNRYILISGNSKDAPSCPYGNKYQWIGFDLQEKKYIRFTKSVFKKLVQNK